MGLDMYLTAKVSLADYDFNLEEREVSQSIYSALGIDRTMLEDTGSVEIAMPVGYWRKANAIHKWFVDNVQEGVDECEEHYVSDEDLEELERVCKLVLADPTDAHKNLPTTSGFCFGGTDYDEWYVRDIEHTLKVIERVKLLVKGKHHCSIYYCSSW